MDQVVYRLYPSRAQLRSSQVHEYLARPPDFAFRAPQIFHHAAPSGRIVVGAVDAHHVHAGPQQIPHQFVFSGCFRRHCNHDPDSAFCWFRAEEFVGVLSEKVRAGLKIDRWKRFRGPCQFAPVEFVQSSQHGVQTGQRLRLYASQRRKTEGRQFLLEIA